MLARFTIRSAMRNAIDCRLLRKAATQGMDACYEFPHGKRFGQVIIRAKLQAGEAIVELAAVVRS